MVKELKVGSIVIVNLTDYGIRRGIITSTNSLASPSFPIAVKWHGSENDLRYKHGYFDYPWVYIAENEKEALKILLKLK